MVGPISKDVATGDGGHSWYVGYVLWAN